MDKFNNAVVGKFFAAHGGSNRGFYLQAYEEGLCAEIFTKLWEHYPRYDWKVRVDAVNGVAQIQLPFLYRSTLGYVLHLDKLAGDPGLRAIVQAGGNLLERWNLRRAKADRDALKGIRSNLPVIGHRTPVPGGMPSKIIL